MWFLALLLFGVGSWAPPDASDFLYDGWSVATPSLPPFSLPRYEKANLAGAARTNLLVSRVS